jgi:4-amino-4-deoxy-L-arabinose transferase-like glycosyltransferase
LYYRPVRIVRLAVLAIVLAQLGYVYTTFPALEDYFPRADEGTYFRQASAIADGGVPALRQLGREFVADPQLQIAPPPTRMGHLFVAAGTLRLDRSFRALSVESWIAFVLTCGAVFVFVRRLWGEPAALAAVVLAVTGPLAAAMARRALSDAEHTLFAVVSVLLFLEWAARPRDKTFVWFLAALTWTALIKETVWFLLPAFAITLAFMRLRGVGDVKAKHLLLLGVVPIAVGAACAIAFGGPGEAATMVSTIRRMNTFEGSRYLRDFHAGPWFTSFVDMFLLAPVTTLVLLISCGWWIGRLRSAPITSVALVWVIAAFACMAALPQNPRYVLPLDVIARIFVAITIAAAALASAGPARWAAATILVLCLAASDVVSFKQLFVDAAIYDPIPYNLLTARHLVPTAAPLRPPPSAATLVDMSLQYYRVRDFRAAIAMAERGVALQPDSAEGYNNMGAAYCELGRWREAVTVLERAVALRPDFEMARNNLAWARSGSAGSIR